MFSYAFTLPFLHTTGHRWVNQISYQNDSYLYIYTSTDQREKDSFNLPIIVFLSSFVVIWEPMEHKQVTISSKCKCQRLSCSKSWASIFPSFLLDLLVGLVIFNSISHIFQISQNHKPLSHCSCVCCPWKRTSHYFHFQMIQFQSRKSVLIENFSPDERFILEMTPDHDWYQPEGSGLRRNNQF